MKKNAFIRSFICLCSLILFFVSYMSAQISAGTRSGSVFAIGGSGALHFNNAAHVQASDDSRSTASAVLTILSGTTDEIRVSGFNFNIPSGTFIDGIVVEVERSATNISALASVSDNSIRLLKAGVITGSNYAKPGSWPGTDTYTSYGSNNDLWGTTWTDADINNAGFGVSFSSSINGLLGLLPTARVDHIRVTVYYRHVILPVHITEFNLSDQEDDVSISWKLENTEILTLVELQRSTDAIQWSSVHTYPASGTGNYRERRRSVNIYYRLKLVTNNAGPLYSGVISVKATAGNFMVYPNPAFHTIWIKGVTDKRLLRCTTLQGIRYPLVFSPAGPSTYTADISLLPAGIYVIIENGKKVLFKKGQ